MRGLLPASWPILCSTHIFGKYLEAGNSSVAAMKDLGTDNLVGNQGLSAGTAASFPIQGCAVATCMLAAFKVPKVWSWGTDFDEESSLEAYVIFKIHLSYR